MGSSEAATVAAVALLPGALYVWGFERHVGSWGIGLSDRVLRFFGVSAFAHAIAAPLTYWLWANYGGDGTVADRRPLSLWLWLAVVAYVVAPFAAGSAVGCGTRRGRAWAATITGPDPAPRAWDHFFGRRPEGWVRLRLKSGTWIVGLYTTESGNRSSYAAGYPEAQDLFLTDTAELAPTSGEVLRTRDGPVRRGISLLIRWDEVEFMEFVDSDGGGHAQEETE